MESISYDVCATMTEFEKCMDNEGPSQKNVKNLRKVDHERKIVWKNVIIFSYIHLTAIYTMHSLYFNFKLYIFMWFYIIGIVGGIGVTAGAHRLWCHRSYKAKWPMRFLLMICQTIALQDSIYQWVRDHRMHHKFTDTDADPYNSRRGFFFSHIGWLMVRKHPSISIKGATIDCSDLEQDPIVTFQKRWYAMMILLFCFIVPVLGPYWFWGDSLWFMWHYNIFRYCIHFNATWSVNSVAHIWGTKPYNKSVSPTDNAGVAFVTLGEGWHNYHHVFPWDYKTGELGNYGLNMTTAFIDFFAYLGLSYDLKTASADMIKKRVLRNNEKDECTE